MEIFHIIKIDGRLKEEISERAKLSALAIAGIVDGITFLCSLTIVKTNLRNWLLFVVFDD